jgi:hypothetical protein
VCVLWRRDCILWDSRTMPPVAQRQWLCHAAETERTPNLQQDTGRRDKQEGINCKPNPDSACYCSVQYRLSSLLLFTYAGIKMVLHVLYVPSTPRDEQRRGEYLDTRGRKGHVDGQNCIVMNFVICISYAILLR